MLWLGLHQIHKQSVYCDAEYDTKRLDSSSLDGARRLHNDDYFALVVALNRRNVWKITNGSLGISDITTDFHSFGSFINCAACLSQTTQKLDSALVKAINKYHSFGMTFHQRSDCDGHSLLLTDRSSRQLLLASPSQRNLPLTTRLLLHY